MGKLPHITSDAERFSIPDVRVFVEGRATVFENFAEIADVLNRNPEHLLKYLLRELGTAGKVEGTRVIFQGRFSQEMIAGLIDDYVSEYVICSECNRPDTHLTKSDRTVMLKCDACGAQRSIRKRYVKKQSAANVLEEGQTYDVRIEAVGKRGDGIAKIGKYSLFVPGAQKGDTVKVRVKKISGTLAFTERVTS
ncbi:MAG: translation initiation factor IF-2 subunit beta [Euryarchaeota archaeon]|nr:translation initiation factor IF-2 subunit beta [Euryarchaeota archaeon]